MANGGYDPERHILEQDAESLVGSRFQEISGRIKKFGFNGNNYVDRLEIGRVLHETREHRGINVKRYFTEEGRDVYELAGPWDKRNLQILREDGSVVFGMENAEFPVRYTDREASIVGRMYFFKPTAEKQMEAVKRVIGKSVETSLRDVVERITIFFTEEGKRWGYFLGEDDANNFHDELAYLQATGIAAFNSPVYFNAGLGCRYGLTSNTDRVFKRLPSGEVKKVGKEDPREPTQLHGCFIKGPDDNLESILEHVADEGHVFGLGSGIGQDIGILRSRGEDLSGGGRASGPLSFLKGYDAFAGVIQSGGKTRRAARMSIISCYHPDIIEFIRVKSREAYKVQILMNEKLSFEEATETVAFQNTNLTVSLDDNFFSALRENKKIKLENIKDKKVVREVSAERMLKEIAFGAWRCGDPGVRYEDRIQEMNTCPNSGRIRASNPCSEYMFLDDTACNLASLNLEKFIDQQGNFDIKGFRSALRIMTLATNISNDAAAYPIESIAKLSPEFRAIGIGFANVGGMLMKLGVPYDSDRARAMVGGLAALMTGTVYETSAELSKALEPFIHFEFNKRPMLKVIKKHRDNLKHVQWDLGFLGVEEAAKEAWDNAILNGERYGFRNAQATVLAPTGTISSLLGCSDSTGIEPCVSLNTTKRLAGGGVLKIVAKNIREGLEKLGYTGEALDGICNYVVGNNTIIGAPGLRCEHEKVFGTALGRGAISLEGHLKMMAAAQPFISGAISKTVNLPESASVKKLYDVILLGESLGIKALAMFRDNSKPAPLVIEDQVLTRGLKRGEKEDMLSEREAHEVEVQINGPKGSIPLHVIVSEYPDGRPGQVVLLSFTSGSEMNALMNISAISASKALKRGVDLENVVAGWLGHKTEDMSGMVLGCPYIKTVASPLDFAARWLLLQYKGLTEFAEPGIEVDIKKLRGFVNGAFRTYIKSKIDPYDIEQVLADPTLGGFVEVRNGPNLNGNGNGKLNGLRGRICSSCGSMMRQTGPNCFSCSCGDRNGGCGG